MPRKQNSAILNVTIQHHVKTQHEYTSHIISIYVYTSRTCIGLDITYISFPSISTSSFSRLPVFCAFCIIAMYLYPGRCQLPVWYCACSRFFVPQTAHEWNTPHACAPLRLGTVNVFLWGTKEIGSVYCIMSFLPKLFKAVQPMRTLIKESVFQHICIDPIYIYHKKVNR